MFWIKRSFKYKFFLPWLECMHDACTISYKGCFLVGVLRACKSVKLFINTPGATAQRERERDRQTDRSF